MADDSDIPPLEDMTDVLKQASAMRAGRLDTVLDDRPSVKTSSAKDRAKVKKNVQAKAVNIKDVNISEAAAAGGDHENKSKVIPAALASASSHKASTPLSKPAASVSDAQPASRGVFGGMKKGFLFGGPPKSSSKPSRIISSAEPVKPVEPKKETAEGKGKNDIPFISPKTGKTESGLTLEEVQRAMSEAKGLLDNQDWINDDLLNNVEKNELLLKRFADPHFMKALQEFQTNPTAAMEKYSGNKEVEKFLVEFCGLLGDHFTNLGNSSGSTAQSKVASHIKSQPSKTSPKISEIVDEKFISPQPKIVEIEDNKRELSKLDGKSESKAEVKDKRSPKIIELTDSDASSESSSELKKLKIPNISSNQAPEVITRSQKYEADIQEVPADEDAKVKEILKDPQVMEVLLNPKVMNLIQQMKADPREAQRTVDTADPDLKCKIKFLVSKGLLQYQTD